MGKNWPSPDTRPILEPFSCHGIHTVLELKSEYASRALGLSKLYYFRYLSAQQSACQNDAVRTLPIAALVFGMLMTPLVFAKQFAVVIPVANATKDLTTNELVKLITGKTSKWPDGQVVTVVMRDPAIADMQIVLRRVLNMSPEQAQAFVRSHKALVVIVESDDVALHVVSSKPGAIGIVDVYSLTKDVNVVKIDGKLPVEQGYLLRGN